MNLSPQPYKRKETPTTADINEYLNNLRKGENMEVNDRLYDLIIIGGGPARTFCRYIYGKSKIQNINT